jgi:hypothetical protein
MAIDDDLIVTKTPTGWNVWCGWTTLHVQPSVHDSARWQMIPDGRDPYEFEDFTNVGEAFDAVRDGLRP